MYDAETPLHDAAESGSPGIWLRLPERDYWR